MILAFVYLGRSLPRYVLANMEQVTRNFPESPLVFIGDNKAVCERVSSKGFQVWLSQDAESAWGINRESMAHDPAFRDGFWFKTLARFYALNEYLRAYPDNESLLIESDVWISPTFPMKIISNLDYQLGFPLTTSKQGVASTFFMKNQASLQAFLDFAKSRVEENPESTDVTILAEYREKYPARVCVFPSGPLEDSGYNENVTLEEKSLLSSQDIFENQIFDGSTWGQFLTGEDPRNSWGFRVVYHAQKAHSVNPSVFKFAYVDKSVQATIFNKEYQINSLHVHSKDITVFSSDSTLNKRVSDYKGEIVNEIVWRLYIRFIPSKLKLWVRTKFSNMIGRWQS